VKYPYWAVATVTFGAFRYLDWDSLSLECHRNYKVYMFQGLTLLETRSFGLVGMEIDSRKRLEDQERACKSLNLTGFYLVNDVQS